MAESLPTDQLQRLNQTLDQWPQWLNICHLKSRPKLLHELSSGSSNHSYLVECQQQKFVVRLDGEAIDKLKLQRSQEWLAQSNAAQAGLAPQPIYQNKDIGCFVSLYIEGELHSDDSKSSQNLKALAELFHKIHQLPAVEFKLNIASKIDLYRQHASINFPQYNLELEKLRTPLATIIERTESLCERKKFCHNDLLAANRLPHKGQIIAIDWEYSAMADPYFDLAASIQGDNMHQDEAEQLLAHYTELNPHYNALARLKLNTSLYAYVDLLWSLTTGINAEKTSIDARLEKLHVLCQT